MIRPWMRDSIIAEAPAHRGVRLPHPPRAARSRMWSGSCCAARRRSRSVEIGDLPPGLLLARIAALDQPGDDARSVRKVRFSRADSASQASRSSPSMSSSNSSAEHRLARRDQSPMSPSAQTAMRIVGGDEAERLEPRALQPAGQQHAERLVRQPALEGIGDHVEAGCRAERSRPAARRASAARERRPAGPQPVGHLLAAGASSASGSASMARTLRRRDRSRAGTCRRHRRGSWDRCRGRRG